MSKRTKQFLFGLVAALAVGAWFRSRGTVTVGNAVHSQQGANVDTTGCPEGFRLRPARGMAKAKCVSRRGDDSRVFEPGTGKLLA